MLTDGGVLFFDWEGRLPCIHSKRLLARIFGDLIAIRVQDAQLLLLCLHVDSEVNEAVHGNI